MGSEGTPSADDGGVTGAQLKPPERGSRWSLLLRVMAFAIWVVALDLWLARHFRSGVEIDQLLPDMDGQQIPPVVWIDPSVL